MLPPITVQPVQFKPRALVISLAIAATTLFFPIFPDPAANRALAILIVAALLWMTEAVPLSMTALLIPVLALLMGVLPAAEAFSQFGNPVIFLFMGGFVLAGALSLHSLDQVLAQKLIAISKGNFYKSAILMMFSTSLLACWISNTSSTAMMIPLGLGLLGLSNKKTISAESKFLMLGIAYSANIGGVITMIATPPNAIGAAILKLSFLEWLTYSIPVFLITFPIMIVVLTLAFKPDRKLSIEKVVVAHIEIKHKKRLLSIFLLTVVLWMSEGLLSPLLNIESGFSAIVALLAIFLLFVCRVMSWDDILASIRWEILLLFGGGLTLGLLLDRSGLGVLLIKHVMDLGETLPLFVFLWLIIIFSIILTEFMSNTASAALILPLLYTLAVQSNLNPLILVLPATIAASFGFMLPVGTPPNAMVFSLGFIPQKQMMKVGLILNFVFSVILALLFYLIFR
ncbi:MAG TPA: DASS family sodium-coupled anion symporter [Flavobacterium sp.]|jgi:sodium-dependent dicarboxylate transporter 2/3/5|nr:DASS family sodium-coupled anion symporter [Flavobacterium sp.]